MVFYDFPYIGNVIIPTDELIFFRGFETTNQGKNWENIGDFHSHGGTPIAGWFMKIPSENG